MAAQLDKISQSPQNWNEWVLYFLQSLAAGGGGPAATVNLTQVGGAPIFLGQTTMANSLPVTVANNQSPMNVRIVDAGGTIINITAGDIDIHTSDVGANFDAIRIGDGSGVYIKVNADGSINTNLANATGPLDYNYGVVGLQTLRTAAQIGNATGAADFDFGASSPQTLRSAALIGNSTGAADFAAGTVGLQTLRVELADKGVVTLPVATRSGNGVAFDDYGAGAAGANTPRFEIADKGVVTLPTAVRESDGVNFLDSVALAAAQFTTGALTAIKAVAGVMLGWDGATHREIAVDATGAIKTVPVAPVATSAAIQSGFVVGILAVTVPSATIFTTDAALGAKQLGWDNNSGAVIEIYAGATKIATVLPGSNGTQPMDIGPAQAVTIVPQVVGLSATEYVAVRVS